MFGEESSKHVYSSNVADTHLDPVSEQLATLLVNNLNAYVLRGL